MVNWNDIDLNDCSDCTENDWRRFYTDEVDSNSPYTASEAHFECRSCGRHGRVYHDSGHIRQTGGLRE